MSKTFSWLVFVVLLVGIAAMLGLMVLSLHTDVVRPGWQKVSFYVEGEQGQALEAYTASLKESVSVLCAENGIEVKETSTNRWEDSRYSPEPRLSHGTELHVWIFIPLQEGVKQSTQAEECHGLLVKRFNGQWSGGKICCRHTDMQVYEDAKFLHTSQYFYMANSPGEEEELRKNGFLNLGFSLSVSPAD